MEILHILFHLAWLKVPDGQSPTLSAHSEKVWLMPNRWGILDDALKLNAGGTACFT